MDEISFIPDDVFYYITNFLTSVECMSFHLSGVSKRFSAFYCRRRKWNLSRCFSLKPNICQRFFSSCLVSSTVQTLDLSHCFWLPEASLVLGCLSQLKNLTELNVLDTELSLSSIILHVMPQCQGLTKLSVKIPEATLEDFNYKLHGFPVSYKENFRKLTFSKFQILDSSSPFIWLLIFNILGWYRDCVELHLELFQSGMTRHECPWEHQESTNAVIDLSRKKLYDQMSWMVSLKSIAVCNRLADRCLDDFCCWLLLELNPPALEKLWFPSVKAVSFSSFKPAPTLSILHLEKLDAQLCFPLFSQLTHLAGVCIPLEEKLPRLRFLRGNFPSFLALDQFCQEHPQLEHLHFDGHDCNGTSSQEQRITFQCQWALARLRTLIFASNNPHPDVLCKFLNSCTKLEELHVGRLSTPSIFLVKEPRIETYRCIAKQQHLKKLTLSWLEFTHGTFLQQVFQSCTLLESFHIAGQFEDGVSFHRDLCKYLPLAKNLKDLRIQLEEIPESFLLELLSTIGSGCSSMERLVINQESWSSVSSTLSSILPDILIKFTTVQLPRLLAFCLVYPLDFGTAKTISNRFKKEILPNRPSFWFYLGDSLPRGTNVPRVHLDEIVDPFEYIDSFPVFS